MPIRDVLSDGSAATAATPLGKRSAGADAPVGADEAHAAAVRDQLEGRFVCPFCGVVSEGHQTVCPKCTMENTPVARKATKSRIGPWYVLQGKNPAAPGMKWETLLAFVEKGRIKPQSIVRGPTTHQLWRFAAHVKGLSREFGVCYSCGGGIERGANLCPQCNRLQEPPINPDVLLEGAPAAPPEQRLPVYKEIPGGADADGPNGSPPTADEPEPAQVREQRETIARERDEVLREREAVLREREELLREREEIVHDREALARDREEVDRTKDAATREREAVRLEQESIARERESVGREREAIDHDRESIAADRAMLARDREAVIRQRETFLRERDAAARERAVAAATNAARPAEVVAPAEATVRPPEPVVAPRIEAPAPEQPASAAAESADGEKEPSVWDVVSDLTSGPAPSPRREPANPPPPRAAAGAGIGGVAGDAPHGAKPRPRAGFLSAKDLAAAFKLNFEPTAHYDPATVAAAAAGPEPIEPGGLLSAVEVPPAQAFAGGAVLEAPGGRPRRRRASSSPSTALRLVKWALYLLILGGVVSALAAFDPQLRQDLLAKWERYAPAGLKGTARIAPAMPTPLTRPATQPDDLPDGPFDLPAAGMNAATQPTLSAPTTRAVTEDNAPPAAAAAPETRPAASSVAAPPVVPTVEKPSQPITDLDQQAQTLLQDAVEAEVRGNFAQAAHLFEEIKRLPRDVWPPDLEMRLRLARAQQNQK